MKKSFLLLLCGLSISLHAASGTVTVNSGVGAGSFPEAVSNILAAETIDFNLVVGKTTVVIVGNQTFASSFIIDGSNSTALPVTLSSVINTLDISALQTTTILVDSGRTFTIGMGITGVGGTGITKTGAGTLVLNNASGSFAGDVSLNLGQITVNDALALGTGAGSVSMATGTTLSLDPITIANPVAITGTGDVEVGIGTATMSGIVSGTGTLRKQGSGTLVLSGVNTHAGGTILSGGQITLNSDTGLGASSGPLSIATGATLLMANTIAAANPVAITGAGAGKVEVVTGERATLSGIISGAGSVLEKTGDGTLELSGVNSYSGGTTLMAGHIRVSNNSALGGDVNMSDGTTLLMSDGVNVGNLIVPIGTGIIEVGTGDSATLSGFVIGAGALFIPGAGSLTLSGANTYSGGTAWDAGIINIRDSKALGSGVITAYSDAQLIIDAEGLTVANNFSLAGLLAVYVDADPAPTVTFTGSIANTAGILSKNGNGTLVLTGANSHTGGTNINGGGKLVISNNDALGAGDLTINDSSTLGITDGIVAGNNITIKDGHSGTFEVGTGATGTLTGAIGVTTGTAVKTGAGELVLSGTNLYTGIFFPQAGTCTVNGSLAGGATVTSGATLKGTGTVNGAVTIDTGGELTPGNSIGTITVASLILNSGSTTNIEFSPLDTSLIDVTGLAALGGTLNLIQNVGFYGASGSYEILTSSDLFGEFDAITGGLSGFTFSLTYNNDNVQLHYTSTASSSISTDGLWGNVLKFANYLNADAPASSEYEALAALTGDAIFDGVNRASPARNAFGTYTSQQTVLSLSNILSNYLGSKRFFQEYSVSKGVAGKILPYESELFAANSDKKNQFDYKREEKKSSMWGSAFVDFAYQDQESQNVAFNFISEGALLGYDYQIDEKNAVGGVISYAHSQIDDKGAMGRSEISYYVAALYANYMKDNFYVEGAFWGVFNQIYTVRNIAFGAIDTKATSNQNGGQINPHIEFGYAVNRNLVEFEPYVALDCVVNWQGSFTEKGAGNLNMHQKAQTSAMLQSQVGLRCYQEIETKKARIGFKEGAGFINRTPFGTGTVTTSIFGTSSFVILKSFIDSQCLGSVEALCFAEVGKNRDFTISLGYQGQFGVQYISNELVLRLSKAF